jgi:tetratricopeptide (TPR) repeat protein
MSERDIEPGQRWNEQISARLRDTHFGIICLTPENLSAPWLLFEAGALAKALEIAQVVPVLLGIHKADLTFPLAQFQAVEADREGFFSLVAAVNRALGEHQLAPDLLANIFNGLWGNLETGLLSLPEVPKRSAQGAVRSDRELLEEVLNGVRGLQRIVTPKSVIQDRGVDYVDWQDHYIRGVNFANSRKGHETNVAALRAYNEAIALAPLDLSDNERSRLYSYRGAILKRLGRLEEARNDLTLSMAWAREDREINDALYNMAGIAAMLGRTDEALEHLKQLISRDSRWSEIVATRKNYFANLENEPEFKKLTGQIQKKRD